MASKHKHVYGVPAGLGGDGVSRCIECKAKKPVKGVSGHPKGGRAEREVAGIVQDWWQRYETAAEFVRTPLSGGWGKARGTKVAAHFNACGDLMTTGARFPFCVEVKWRESWSYDNLTNCKPTPPWEWWRQCLGAATKQEAVPMMWMRKNHIRRTRDSFPWLVWVPLVYGVEKRLSEPDIVWSEQELRDNNVDCGGVLPVAYFYDRFIAMAPQRMATTI